MKSRESQPATVVVSKIEHQDAAKLAAGYKSGFRSFEFLSIGAFCALSAAIVWRIAPHADGHSTLLFAAFLMGLLSADLVSGIVHWMGDTWGSTDMPLLGQTLIRTFREHHVDQKAITRHDFVETNGTNCMISLPVLVIALLLPVASGQPFFLFVAAWLLSLTLWVFATNQIHKWAHQDQPAAWVALLQRSRLVLSPGHHSVHHSAPYTKYYCITTGWMNPILSRISFFPVCERIVTQLTGLVPRQDDIGKDAAIELALKSGVIELRAENREA